MDCVTIYSYKAMVKRLLVSNTRRGTQLVCDDLWVKSRSTKDK